MKLKHFITFVATIAIMASCSSEDMGNNALNNFVLKASVDNSTISTRAGFDSGAKFYWSKNDQLGVTTTNSKTSFSALTLQGEGGAASGTFTGDIYGTIEGYAVYPHNRNHKMNNEGILTYQFPANYEYNSVDTEYFHTTDQGKANSFNFAMWGKIQNGSVGMKHLGGVFMVAFTSIPAEGTFILSADQKLNGNYSVDLNSNTPEVVIDGEYTPTDAEKQVVISYTNATDGQTGVFYVPAPTGNYTNVTATIINAEGETIKEVACGDIEIRRAYGKILNFTNGSISGGGTEEVDNVEEANKALQNENVTSVKIEEVSANETIIVPEKTSSDIASVPHSIDLSNVTLPTEGVLNIQVTEASTEDLTVKELTVVVPDNTESTSQLNIDAPGTTVIIQTATGTVIDVLTASTADETLVIGADVQVKTLVVKKGNVRIEDGGKVQTIQRQDNQDNVTYVIYESATAPTIELGEGVLLVSAAEFDLRQAAKNGGTYTLTDNVTLSEILVIEKPLVLDGNGHTLTSTAGRAINVSGADGVTIKNLTINATGERAINIIQSATNVTIDHVTATAANYAVNVASSASEAVVNITNSDLTGLNVINIGASGAQIAVNQTKITCNDQTGGENYGAIALNDDATNANVVATGVTFDIKGDSKQVSNGATGATVSINGANVPQNAVAKIEYGAYYHSFETIEGAISKAMPGETVKLIADVTASSIIVVDKAITLDGNGHTLTSTAERAINVSGADGVTIKNLTINATGERAINIIQNATNVTIDHVIATAANYTVNVAGSAPSAKVEIKNSILSGLCTVNVSAASADVEVDNSTINCNDHNTTAGEAYAALSLNKDAVGGKITATNTTINVVDGSDSFKGRNGAENGEVTINGSTAGVVVMVAYITYPGSDYYHAFATLAKAVEFAKEGDVISLLRNIEISETIVVEKAVTIDLNDKTVTANCKKAFEVYADVTIENGTIISQQRCVDTRTNVNLTLTDVTLKADIYYSAYGNQQPLTIGGSTNGTKVSMTNVTIDAGYQGYAIISFVKTEFTATNSKLNGYAALYVREGSDGSQFNFNNGSTLSGTTGSNDVAGNSFATIAIEANNVTVTMDESSSLQSEGTHHNKIYIKEDVTGSSVSGPDVE